MAIIAEQVDKVCTTMLESTVPNGRLADAMNGASNAKVSLSPTFYAARLWKHVESLVSVGKPADAVQHACTFSNKIQELEKRLKE